ncbi:hypothetical protein [Flavobacterium chungbukense]|uniref:Outer membrane protein beta-barrel domain-containing protein n=1 Tax=Flavobacterium chungbukense TaxID=877464 RepID=A0ABP7XJD1_9FLAO|nr:hypothetical protein [Flavobacterium chungbukense]MCC4923072.1 hypothetical protein [Flavobacterium chungbukense]
MKRKLLNLFFVLVFSNFVSGQEASNLELKEKTNPIIFFEGFGGLSVVKNLGVSGGVGLNYQMGESLFTFRYINSAGYRRKMMVLLLLLHRFISQKIMLSLP